MDLPTKIHKLSQLRSVCAGIRGIAIIVVVVVFVVVQSCFIDTLRQTNLIEEVINYSRCSRTDKGVSGFAQVVVVIVVVLLSVLNLHGEWFMLIRIFFFFFLLLFLTKLKLIIK